MGVSQDLYKKAKKIIPGGTQLLSKRPEMFLPDYWPAYYQKAKGCEVWDLDGKKYIDMSYMGIGACTIGYADDEIDEAVQNAIKNGSMCTLNAPEEVELAQLLIELHPWADMVRYARCGGEAMAIAVRIARAKTQKDIVLFCGYHGWSDWYLAANLADEKSLDGHLLAGLNPLGVPRGLKGTSYPFNYNNTEEFLALFNKYKDNIGAVIIEAIRSDEPNPEFISTIRDKTREFGIPFIADEVSSGWRLNLGGAHLLHNYEPDIAVFAKGMSNGFPMAAIIGRGDVMKYAQDSFISSTYWTDRIGPVAAVASIKKMRKENVQVFMNTVGKRVKEIWKSSAETAGLRIHISGINPLAHFDFQYDNALILKTLFTQCMLEKGFLATNAFYASFAHKEEFVSQYENAVREVFSIIANSLGDGKINNLLHGPICHSGFKRLT